MSKYFYIKLAAGNLKKNSQTYLPYIFAGVFCIAMSYIILMLLTTNFFVSEALKQILLLGNIIIGAFSVIFLFYTHSFLIKKRKMEFGLYNVLGMNKRNIGKVISLETIYITFISLFLGLLTGVILSKLIYLILEKVINFELSDEITISFISIIITALLFIFIFTLTLLNSLRLIHLSKPMELLRGGQKGEKEPKIKWILTVIGLAALGLGYYKAITIQDPLDALVYFFIAVMLVIIGTYCLFTSISIFVLKILRKNKNYYYKTNHFISVSSMMYRMKQNAVGLANICILSTIVLITISTTASLYVGVNNLMDIRYPGDILVRTEYEETNTDIIDSTIKKSVEDSGYRVSEMSELMYYCGFISGYGNRYNYSVNTNQSQDQTKTIIILPLESYNRITSEDVSLSEGEIVIYTDKNLYPEESFSIGTYEFSVKSAIMFDSQSPSSNKLSGYVGPLELSTYCVIVPDLKTVLEIQSRGQESITNEGFSEEEVEKSGVVYRDISFDMNADDNQQFEFASKLEKALIIDADYEGIVKTKAGEYQDFYYTFGGLLFLGIYLGVLFLMAVVLIIYYKQISEGHEDKERFSIMQSIGLTKKEVRKAIRSQILTMFFMPLVVACIHISFAFPMISKMLRLLNLTNTSLFMICMIICAAVFALLYIIVYSLTSRIYYRIVETTR